VINAYYHKFEAQHIREEEVGDGKGSSRRIRRRGARTSGLF